MKQDQLIQALMTHLNPEDVIAAKENGTMFAYYVTLANNILGAQTQTQTTKRQTVRPAVPARAAVDLNQQTQQETVNETAAETTQQTDRPAAPRQPARAPAGDRVAVRAL